MSGCRNLQVAGGKSPATSFKIRGGEFRVDLITPGVWLWTQSWQGEGFYQKLGDSEFAVRCSNQTTEIGAMRKMSSDLTARKSASSAMVRHPVARAPIGTRHVAMCIALVFAHLPATTLADSSCPGIHVKILDIKNSAGAVACALFEAPEGFPKKFLRYATSNMMIKIRDTEARCGFLDVPPGTYALAVIHDENRDGELATNWLGVPTEGYGFSNDAKNMMSAPSFEDASFDYDGQSLDMTITLNY